MIHFFKTNVIFQNTTLTGASLLAIISLIFNSQAALASNNYQGAPRSYGNIVSSGSTRHYNPDEPITLSGPINLSGPTTLSIGHINLGIEPMNLSSETVTLSSGPVTLSSSTTITLRSGPNNIPETYTYPPSLLYNYSPTNNYTHTYINNISSGDSLSINGAYGSPPPRTNDISIRASLSTNEAYGSAPDILTGATMETSTLIAPNYIPTNINLSSGTSLSITRTSDTLTFVNPNQPAMNEHLPPSQPFDEFINTIFQDLGDYTDRNGAVWTVTNYDKFGGFIQGLYGRNPTNTLSKARILPWSIDENANSHITVAYKIKRLNDTMDLIITRALANETDGATT